MPMATIRFTSTQKKKARGTGYLHGNLFMATCSSTNHGPIHPHVIHLGSRKNYRSVHRRANVAVGRSVQVLRSPSPVALRRSVWLVISTHLKHVGQSYINHVKVEQPTKNDTTTQPGACSGIRELVGLCVPHVGNQLGGIGLLGDPRTSSRTEVDYTVDGVTPIPIPGPSFGVSCLEVP